jgi:hypothetical protein
MHVMSAVHGAYVMSVVHGAYVMSVVHGAYIMSTVHGAYVMSVVHGAYVMSAVHGAYVMSAAHSAYCLNQLAFAAGQREEARSTSGRTLIFMSYMMSVLLVAAFSAFLVSSLAVQPRRLPFNDLQGLVNDGSYRLGVVPNSSVLNIFDVCLRKMYVRMYACICVCTYV